MQMKRVGALLADMFLVTILAALASMAVLILFRRVPSFFANLMVQVILFAYTFICDACFDGITLGKKLAGLRIQFEPQSPRNIFPLVHAVCRTIITSLAIIGLILFLCGAGTMPYDKWLKIRVVEK